MGGIWGLSAATALENLPVEARGIASGFLQQGYAAGYLITALVNLFLVPKVSVGWRALFWTGAGISLFAAVIRAMLPESELFLKTQAAEKARGTNSSQKTKTFIHETKAMLKKHWLLCIYAVLLMTGINLLVPLFFVNLLFRFQLPLSRVAGTTFFFYSTWFRKQLSHSTLSGSVSHISTGSKRLFST